MNKVVTLVIVTWNQLEYTKLCVESIKRYTTFPYKLVFVDNGSSDVGVDFLRGVEGAVVVRNRSNLGYPKAVNQGVERVDTDYFCLLNNDIIVSENWLSDLVRIFEATPGLEQLTTNSNTIIDKSKPFEGVSFDSWMEFKRRHCRWSPKRLFDAYYGDYDRLVKENRRRYRGVLDINPSPPWFLGGWCLLMRRSVLGRIGGSLYDERFKIAFWEDVDLSWRLGLAGGKLAVAREVYLHHFINTSASKLSKSKVELARENKYRFMEKWESFILTFLKEKSRGRREELKKLVEGDFVLRGFLEYFGMKQIMRGW